MLIDRDVSWYDHENRMRPVNTNDGVFSTTLCKPGTGYPTLKYKDNIKRNLLDKVIPGYGRKQTHDRME